MRRFLFLLAAAGVMVTLMSGCQERASAQVPAGTLLVVDNRPSPHHGVVAIDVNTGTENVVFTAPEFSQIHEIAADPERNQTYLAYTPPPAGGSGFLDRSGVYQLFTGPGGSRPEPVIGGVTSQEFLLEIDLYPDSNDLYFVRYSPLSSGGITSYSQNLVRFNVETGRESAVAAGGSWPAISPDGGQVAYVYVDPASELRGLVIANTDGSDPTTLIPPGSHFDIDRPLFSPDGAWIYFAVATPETSGWWERMLGIAVAEAHAGLPATWWRIPAAGGPAKQVTQEPLLVNGAAFSQGGRFLAVSTPTGIVIYAGDSGLERLRLERTDSGDIVWLIDDF